MKAIDLIIQLQKCNPNTEVVFEITSDEDEMFKLVSIGQVDQIRIPENDKYILLSSGVEYPEKNNNKRTTKKQKFIGEYLDKKMKNHNLPYGMQYLNLLAKTEQEAERKWKLKQHGKN